MMPRSCSPLRRSLSPRWVPAGGRTAAPAAGQARHVRAASAQVPGSTTQVPGPRKHHPGQEPPGQPATSCLHVQPPPGWGAARWRGAAQALPLSLLVFCPELAAVQSGDPRTADLRVAMLQDGASAKPAWTARAGRGCVACIFVEASVRCVPRHALAPTSESADKIPPPPDLQIPPPDHSSVCCAPNQPVNRCEGVRGVLLLGMGKCCSCLLSGTWLCRFSHPVGLLPAAAVVVNNSTAAVKSVASGGPRGSLCSDFMIRAVVPPFPRTSSFLHSMPPPPPPLPPPFEAIIAQIQLRIKPCGLPSVHLEVRLRAGGARQNYIKWKRLHSCRGLLTGRTTL